MIELPRSSSPATPPRLKILGVGGAGGAMLDRLAIDGLTEAELIAINTDVQALTGCIAGRHVHLGPSVTHGLGTGGDPELGYTAAEESMEEIKTAVGEAGLVFLLGGLGGGTSSGAMPMIAHAARTNGARVVVLATLPFAFEGKRRQAQAQECLHSLRDTCDLLICFENDRMAEVVSARAGVQEGFAAVDATLSECVRSLAALSQCRGLLHAGFEELAALFQGADLRALFGCGQAAGDNRAHEAIEAMLKNPLLERGAKLKEIESAVLHLTGGADLTLSEVQTAVEAVRKHLPEDADLHVGLAVNPALAGKLSATVLAALPSVATAPAPRRVRTLPMAPLPEEPEPEFEAGEILEEPVAETAETAAMPVEEPAAPIKARTRMRPLFAPIENVRRAAAESEAESEDITKPREVKQEQMLFEPVNRGRFEKSEPTIIDGQDLDVPTFLRRNLRFGK